MRLVREVRKPLQWERDKTYTREGCGRGQMLRENQEALELFRPQS